MLQGMMMVERFICHVCGKLGPGSVPGQLCGHWLHDLFWPCAVAAARRSTGKRIMLSERERERVRCRSPELEKRPAPPVNFPRQFLDPSKPLGGQPAPDQGGTNPGGSRLAATTVATGIAARGR